MTPAAVRPPREHRGRAPEPRAPGRVPAPDRTLHTVEAQPSPVRQGVIE